MISPDALRPHYASFLAPGRVLLTGHSHQAWPNAARDAMTEAFDDAARLADDKWGPAFDAATELRGFIARRLACRPDAVALAPNTHELVCRFLSALEWSSRPKLVTTTGEFHSITRQLRRLEEEKRVEVVWVPAAPAATLAERLAASVDVRTAAVLTSTVLFETSARVPHLAELVRTARAAGAEVLLDAYHAFNVVPFTVASLGAEDAFIVAGGYKYAQWGEGNCFLVVPSGRRFRPLLTGWFASFATLAAKAEGVGYGAAGAESFAGATYDPVSHYRARAVARFFDEQGLGIAELEAISQRQTSRLMEGLRGLEVLTPNEPNARGGFVAFRHPDANALIEGLRARRIVADARGDVVRLGPAPYLLDAELEQGLAAVRALAR